jgi:TDG/mug DNA glycosylase family protein
MNNNDDDDRIRHRRRTGPAALPSFAARVPPGVRADIGRGPGCHSADLGEHVVALDAAPAAARRARASAPSAWPVVADPERLPFRTAALTGAWAHESYAHIPAERLPLVLADLHRGLALGGALHLRVASGRHARGGDRSAGRHVTAWPAARLRDVVEGAGFEIERCTGEGEEWLEVEATRAFLLPDTVGAGMRVLVVGLNPGVMTAERGIGFVRPGNRFWPAAHAAGLVSRPYDPVHALRVDGVGMTNLVRRTTRTAGELAPAEYAAGAERLGRLVAWLRPRTLCFVGLTGYRAAVDRRAAAGWQRQDFAGVPTYVMPNTSGLNAHARPADFVAHLRAVQRPPT